MNLTSDTLLPSILGLIFALALLGYLYYRKSNEISSWRVAIWIVWTIVLFGLLALIGVKIDALPYSFTIVATGSLLLGTLYFIIAPLTLSWWRRNELTDVFLTSLMLMFFGIAGFSVIYSLLSGSGTSLHYLLVAMLAFILPCLVVKSYDYWMYIPQKKYKTWVYPLNAPVPRLQPVDPIKLMMNFTPVPSGKNGPFESYEVEFPTNESVSDLFHYFISFHNKHREYRKKPIQYLEGERPLGWVLFKYSSQKKRLYLDMDKTLIQNQVSANEHIYAASSIGNN